MSGLLPTLRTDEVPQNVAKRIKGLGITGRPEVREISGGYVQVVLPLHFPPAETPVSKEALEGFGEKVTAAYDNGTVDATIETLGLRTFTARWNLRPEWFEPGFSQTVKNGGVSDNEKIQYQINMAGLTRGLFATAGLENIDFDDVGGQVVGFTTRNRKDDPSRLDIGGFFQAKK